MMNWWYVGAVFTIGILGGWLFVQLDDGNALVPKNDIVVAFGDSLVAGVGATPGNDFVARTAAVLGRPIVNLGVSGDTTRDGLTRLVGVRAHNAGVVVLLLGGNDYLQQIPAEETEVNLATIIEALQQDGAIVVLLGVRGGLLRDNFSAMYARLAEQYETPYVPDVLNGLFGDNRYMSDAVHPNDAGHAMIGERVAAVLDASITWQE